MKRKVFILLAVILLMLPSIVNAESVKQDSIKIVTPDSSVLISRAISHFQITPTDDLAIMGLTESYFTVDSIKITTYLQYWDGSSWQEADSWSSTRYNNDYAIVGVELCVPSDIYLRVKSVHEASLGHLTERMYTYSSPIIF